MHKRSSPQRVLSLVMALLRPRSLFWRLLMLFLLVVLVAVITMGISADWLSQHELKNAVDYTTLQRGNAEALANRLHMSYTQSQTPEEIQMLVEHQAQTSHVQILLVDQHGQVIADSLRSWLGRVVFTDLQPQVKNTSSSPVLHCSELTARANVPLLLAYLDRTLPCSGRFTILGLAGDAFSAPIGVAVSVPFTSQPVVLASTGDILLVAMLIGGCTAFLLAVLFSLTMLTPLHTLTRAVQRMEHGDLSARVVIKTGGELGSLGQAFNIMAHSLQHAEQLRRTMVSDIAHELRTPLTTIQAYLDALHDHVVEPTSEIITSLQEESLLLGHLVADLQDLSLAEAGHLALHRQPMSLHTCIAIAVQGFQASIRNKPLSILIDFPDTLPMVDADEMRVGQILRNLLANAVMYTPPYGTITVGAAVMDHAIQIRVQNAGEEIEAGHLPYLFDRFYRVDTSRSRKTGGIGLGLAIVKQFVQAHGGHVSVQSTPGQGTCFFFTLPITSEDESIFQGLTSP